MQSASPDPVQPPHMVHHHQAPLLAEQAPMAVDHLSTQAHLLHPMAVYTTVGQGMQHHVPAHAVQHDDGARVGDGQELQQQHEFRQLQQVLEQQLRMRPQDQNPLLVPQTRQQDAHYPGAQQQGQQQQRPQHLTSQHQHVQQQLEHETQTEYRALHGQQQQHPNMPVDSALQNQQPFEQPAVPRESVAVSLQRNPVTNARSRASEVSEESRRRRANMMAELLRTFFRPTLGSSRYVAVRFIGEGAYGVVVSAKDTITGDIVAVKRIRKCLNNYPMFTRALRELKFLRLLSPHKNIINVRDVLLPGEYEKFNDTFVVCEKMPMDLKQVLASTAEITHDHVKYFMFQLLCGIHYMHSASVFHRDLKPSNILINEKCELRICDFGLARASYESGPDTTRFWTDYVATRWYRAPELIMEDHSTYSTAIDMWSVGCIFAEILAGGKVLFQGNSKRHMFELITDILGSPPQHVLEGVRNQMDRRILSEAQHPHRPPRNLAEMFPCADHQAIDLLRRLLVLEQDQRISAWDALHLPYFAQYLYLGFGEEATPLPASEFQFERVALTHDQMRHELLTEILHYHPNETLAVLERYGIGNNVAVPSAVQNFVQQMDDVGDGGAKMRSTTMPEHALARYTDGRSRKAGQSVPHAPVRQHGTMTESELALFNRTRIPRHVDL
jgi:serine/threonine protein kinase